MSEARNRMGEHVGRPLMERRDERRVKTGGGPLNRRADRSPGDRDHGILPVCHRRVKLHARVMLSLRALLATITLAAGLLAVGCSHAAKVQRPAGPGIGGTVIYITNATLPTDATIQVRLLELNRDGRVDRVLVDETYPRPQAMPLEFFLRYQPGLIDKRNAYGVDAKIVFAERTLFATERPIPVLTRGNPDTVEVVVVPVK